MAVATGSNSESHGMLHRNGSFTNHSHRRPFLARTSAKTTTTILSFLPANVHSPSTLTVAQNGSRDGQLDEQMVTAMMDGQRQPFAISAMLAINLEAVP